MVLALTLTLVLVLTLALAPSGMISKKGVPEFCPSTVPLLLVKNKCFQDLFKFHYGFDPVISHSGRRQGQGQDEDQGQGQGQDHEKVRQRSALLQLQMVLALTLTLVLALTPCSGTINELP